MKKIYCLLLSACLFSCTDDLDNLNAIPDGVVELTGISATIETGAAPETRAVTYLSDAISRYQFEDEDRMTFTTIKRTTNPLPNFNYVGVEFQSNSSGAWDRDKTTGSLIGSTDDSHPERVYWSDASSYHTFIGYSLPKQAQDVIFDWVNIGDDKVTYYGSIGDKNKTNSDETIDFNSLANSTYTQSEIDAAKAIVEKAGYVSGTDKTAEAIANKTVGDAKPYESEMVKRKVNGKDVTVEMPISSKMRAEDLLLTYSTDLVADASVAKVKFYHALSSIKVQVSISGYYGSEIDGYTIVENMKLLHQPTLYQWNQQSAGVSAKSNTHADNNPKDMMLWDYVPEGSGSGAGKTFSFYGITVPQEEGYQFQDLELTFDVKHPDPLKTDLEKVKNGQATIDWTKAITKQFTAKILANEKKVYFHPGQCTVINLKLNHQDEDMTIGAEYMEWQFISTPDEGSLHKNTTFLQNTERSSVKLSSDNVTQDDATWLYYKQENGAVTEELLDIYGNTGTATSPYKISTADQLLAFAYEVNEHKLNFKGKYIELDADIFMQASADLTVEEMTNAKYTEKEISDAKAVSGISWIGIGDGTTSFNGTFLGGGRQIARIMGSPLFNTLGADAKIDNLVLSDVATNLTGTGTLANTNNGEIVGCVVNAKVKSTASGAGALVGTNTSTGKIITCYHVGGMEGTDAVSGLVGTNQGTMTGCYNAGTIVSSNFGTCYGVTNNGGTVTGCYYNKTLAGNLGEGGKTTVEMQKLDFTNSINYSLPTDPQAKYSYKFSATQYPSLVPYNVTKPTLLPDGFYRVKNVGSERYVYVTDNKGHYNTRSSDLDAIVLHKDFTKAISDPSSVIYVKSTGSNNEYDLIGQGASIKDIAKHYAVIVPTNDHYRVGAQETFVSYLADATPTDTPDNQFGIVSTQNPQEQNLLLWDAIPVDDASSNYFGLSAVSAPFLTKESKTTYYVPFYAGFGFDPASRGMEVFYISQMNESEGKVCLKKITGTVPANTPVIVACSAADASGNRLSLKYSNATFAPKNYLKGNMFNFTNEDIPGKLITHTNRTTYKPETMRVLEVRDGELAFVKKTDLSYLPANSSYLVVSAGAPEVITVETEETYNEPSGTTNNPIEPGYYHVQNFGSKRYLSVVDDKVSINVQEVNITHDLNALALNKTLNTYDPGSIVYVTADGDVTSQGVSLKSKIPGFTINERKDAENRTHYRVGAERSGLSRYICDAITTNTEESGKVDTHVGDDKNYLLWDAIKVNEFTLSSTITASSTYYAPFYAEFGFEIPSGMDVYYVEKVNLTNSDNPRVVLKKLSGTIPNNTPVIIAYSSSANKLVPKFEDTSLSVANLLKGNMFKTSTTGHVHRTPVTANMRVLSVGTDGNLVFSKPTDSYLPANQSYLIVDTTEETLSVVFDN